MRLEELLGVQKSDDQVEFYEYLPVKTSLSEELKKTGEEVFKKHYEFSEQNIKKSKLKQKPKWEEFISNIDTEDAKNDLVMLKLRGLIDQTKFGKSTEIKKLPKKVQKGTISGGGGFQEVRRRKTKKHDTLVDTLLQLDEQIGYSTRRFVDIQKQKQQRKRISKKSVVQNNKKLAKGKRSNYQ